MNEINIKKRRSLHGEQDQELEENNVQDLKECRKCKKKILVNNDGTEIPMNEDDTLVENWISLQKKRDIEIKLSELESITCKRCTLDVTQRSKVESIFSKWKVVVAILIFVFVSGSYSKDILGLFPDIYTKIRSQNTPINPTHMSAKEKDFDKHLAIVEKEYSKQLEDTWITLASGIKNVISVEPNRPSTFLVLYDNESVRKTAECIIKEVSELAIKFLLEKTGTPEIISGGNLNSEKLVNDPGQLLIQLNDPVRNKGALVVTNLHEVTPVVAKEFHFICDSYSPLVETAVTFFTLKVDKMPSVQNMKKAVASRMEELWSKEMSESTLNPLITRMTTHIITIIADKSC